MEKRQFKISKIDNVKNFNELLDFLVKKYGDLITITIVDKNNACRNFYNVQELNDSDIINSKKITINLMNQFNVLLFQIESKTNEMTMSCVSMDKLDSINKSKINVNLDLDKVLQNDGSLYYKFDNGLILKLKPDEGLYYRLDENNNWIQDGSLCSLFYDSKHEFEEIKKKRG